MKMHKMLIIHCIACSILTCGEGKHFPKEFLNLQKILFSQKKSFLPMLSSSLQRSRPQDKNDKRFIGDGAREGGRRPLD